MCSYDLDAAALLRHVEQHAAALALDLRERMLELLAAVAAERVEDVARQALRVDADEHVLGALDVALHERDVRLAGERLAVGDGREVAVHGRHAHRRRALDELLRSAPVLDQVGDRDEGDAVARAVLDEVGHAGEERGVLLYMSQEGRGIGLLNKLKAYELQDAGADTVEANERLGFAPDLRNYGIGAQILLDLGLRSIRPITNNPRKMVGLEGYGLHVDERVPIVQPENVENAGYMGTKRDKLGHLLAS